MSNELDITLEDVETAIRILNAFIKRAREANLIMRKLELEFRGYRGYGMPSFEDIMRMVFAQRREALEELPKEETEFTEEDLKRIREIRDRLKSSQR